MSLSAGTRLGPYEILEPLGQGGMGEVWKARDTRLNRIVAVKRLRNHQNDRFAQEAHAIAALNHPHICQIHDVGPDYLVLEYIEGQTLADLLTPGAAGAPVPGPLPLESVRRLALEIVSALEEAHGKGILHRDLKPGNIMVTKKGVAKLLDFGLARLVSTDADVTRTTDGAVTGTAAYMAPEQAQGGQPDQRSDIFSFGAVLFEMLSGTRPFGGRSTAEVLSAVLRDDPPPLQAPPALERIVRRCLQKSPNQRFQTAGELRAAFEHSSAEPTATGGQGAPSIAVLPFANMSADKDNDYFSDGLAEEIISVLANVPGVKVAGRTSSFFFRGKDVEFGEIGRKLNVDHILEGSVRRAGNRIRVTAQLVKVADGFQLWSDRYDREVTDVFAMQDEITRSIAAALQVKLSPSAAPVRRTPPNLRAYEAYLKARDHWSRATAESLARTKEFLEQSIELDPEFAPAYSLLGVYYSMLAHLGVRPAREVIPLARAAEYEALRVEPSLPEAHALLGVWAGTFDYDWTEAERRWRLAMAAEPLSTHVLFWYGNHYLLPTGRPLEAVDAMARGLEADPLNLLYRHLYAVGLRHAGRLDDAEVELRRVLELDEQFWMPSWALGAICAQRERFDEALALTEKACALAPWAKPITGQLAALLARAGATSRADALVDGLRQGGEYGAATGLAVFHAMRGEFDQAAEWTERAIEERFVPLVAILGPLLRSNSRWPALARLMNLPERPSRAPVI